MRPLNGQSTKIQTESTPMLLFGCEEITVQRILLPRTTTNGGDYTHGSPLCTISHLAG